ncbi:MAG TPA: AMP-binding protein [Solirubrobacteraceae bacterium]|nr:AMP-binding protein [Solirubrobacteraceae bacterium]
MNFAFDLLQAQPPDRLALVELAHDGARREWSFGDVERRSAAMAGVFVRHGLRRGDVAMTLIGNRPEWVFAMMGCFRIGAVVLPCTEQLRAKDLRLRLSVASPSLIVADERNREQIEAAAPSCPVMWVGGDEAFWPEEIRSGNASQTAMPPRAQGASSFGTLGDAEDTTPHADTSKTEGPPRARGASSLQTPPPHAELAATDPALITFTSGTAGEPKAVVHGQRYLYGQRVQAEHWLGAKEGELVWCTAASGWSKSARNVFMAPWLMGAPALLHDARFDPHERLDLIEREQVSVLCMAPTEYRVIAKRAELRALPSLKGMVAAGEALNPEVLKVWRDATGLDIRDGYGQTETGQMTGMGIGVRARPGSMGQALPDTRLGVIDGELVADPHSVPTFFLGYLGEDVRHMPDGGWTVQDRRDGGSWHTGDRVREDDDGYLHFEGRADDVIISAGYRIGPFEVESALVAHPAVAEAAAVAAPDEERGAVVRAVVVLRDGYEPSDALASELQEHVKRETAPYKYPRIVEFADELPKTASGKVKRAELRAR